MRHRHVGWQGTRHVLIEVIRFTVTAKWVKHTSNKILHDPWKACHVNLKTFLEIGTVYATDRQTNLSMMIIKVCSLWGRA